MDEIIDKLKRVEIIQSCPEYAGAFQSISKYAEDDRQKAYLLGWFFKYKLDSDELQRDDKRDLIDAVKSRKLEAYFYLKTKPDFGEMSTFMLAFMLMGLVLLIVGTLQYNEGRFTAGNDLIYGIPVIREGGFKIIAGVGLFGVGVYQVRQGLKKKRFLRGFLRQV